MKGCLVLALLLIGCNPKSGSSNQAPEQKNKTQKSHEGRFQTFHNLPGVALDTVSGKLCKTYEPGKTDNIQDKEASIPSQYNSQPLCSTLSNCD